MTPTVRIGNAQAFWGDRSDAAAELLAQVPELDYLTLDYLAEVSMSILASQRERNPALGYAADFVDVVRSLAPYWRANGKCRVITNAGGLSPANCARACATALEEAGCRPLQIAVVTGDDVLDHVLKSPDADSFCHLESGAPLPEVAERLVTANAYLGAPTITEALAAGADIVITGRVADPSMVVGACVHHFGWTDSDYDRLAGATIAGHLIECGTQVTGGISSDWLALANPTHVGFPIVEFTEDGSCVVTKPAGTGGEVTLNTVREQLLYEIGDPAEYLSPDVQVSFLSLEVEDLGDDRVRVSGASGSPPPPTLKVSATYRDGFWSAGTLTIIGRDARSKAQRCGEIVLTRVREAGFELRETLIECTESSDAHGQLACEQALLRVAAIAEAREALTRFAKELMPLITAGPPGTTGYSAGRPRVHPLFRYWPCLIDRSDLATEIAYVATAGTAPVAGASPPRVATDDGVSRRLSPTGTSDVRGTLAEIAIARSGDKGTSANVGVIARRTEDYELLSKLLTTDRVQQYFAPLGAVSVTRYELPNLAAFNFILHGILSSPLKTDAQGKGLGQIMLQMPLE